MIDENEINDENRPMEQSSKLVGEGFQTNIFIFSFHPLGDEQRSRSGININRREIVSKVKLTFF